MDIVRNGKQAKMGRKSPKERTKQMGLVEKPINFKSKGYGNLGRGSPKDLAKTYGNEGLEQAEDAQKNKMGQGSPRAMKWEWDVARPTLVSGDGWAADRLVGGLGRTSIPGQKC